MGRCFRYPCWGSFLTSTYALWVPAREAFVKISSRSHVSQHNQLVLPVDDQSEPVTAKTYSAKHFVFRQPDNLVDIGRKDIPSTCSSCHATIRRWYSLGICRIARSNERETCNFHMQGSFAQSSSFRSSEKNSSADLVGSSLSLMRISASRISASSSISARIFSSICRRARITPGLVNVRSIWTPET